MAKGLAITLVSLGLIGLVGAALIAFAPDAVLAGYDYIIQSAGLEGNSIFTTLRTSLAEKVGN